MHYTQPDVDDSSLSICDDAQYAYVPKADVFENSKIFLAFEAVFAVFYSLFLIKE